MSGCSDIKLGQIDTIGKSKVSAERAVTKGIKDFFESGRSGCVGPCDGGSCTFRALNLTVKMDYSIQDGTHYAYVSGRGECFCG